MKQLPLSLLRRNKVLVIDELLNPKLLSKMYKRLFKQSVCLFLLISCLSFSALAQKGHDFMHQKYDELHDSPMQQKFRKIAPVPAGVVYIQRPGEGEEETRQHFRTMKELGFTNRKQIMTLPDWSHEKIQMIALKTDIIPWWYGEGGWKPLTDALIKK